MKRKDAQALANMSAAELEKKVAETRTRLEKLQFQKHAAKLKNPHEITAARKDIARMLTALRSQALSAKN